MAEQQSLYTRLKSNDVISMVYPLLASGVFRAREPDGYIVPNLEGIMTESPWIHTAENDLKFHCRLWHNISFNVVSKNIPKPYQFVPRGCQECWKVVVKPKTVEQLFSVLDIQQKLNRTSKCGIEERPTVKGLYGAYFFNNSLDEGLERYEIIKSELLNTEVLSPLVDEVDQNGRTTRIILKRGCTEMEHTVGPSNKWEITETQNMIEDLIEKYIEMDLNKGGQPPHIINHIKCRWIEWAAGNEDETYLNYTDGPLTPDVAARKTTNHNIPGYFTYHQSELKKRRS